jgi:hypothetical protein
MMKCVLTPDISDTVSASNLIDYIHLNKELNIEDSLTCM